MRYGIGDLQTNFFTQGEPDVSSDLFLEMINGCVSGTRFSFSWVSFGAAERDGYIYGIIGTV